MKKSTLVIALSISIQVVMAQAILFKNVNIFDGKSDELISAQDVLVDKNLISQIGSNLQVTDSTQVIDGGGMTLIPGFIESHVHLNFQHVL